MTARLFHRVALAAGAVTLALASLTVGAMAQSKVLRWGNNGEISTMDPHGAFSTANASLLGNIYESLVRHDRNLKFEPALATSWKVIAPDHWRFFIRPGVHFHDGAPLTGRDVVASLKRASLPDSPYLSATHMIKDAVLVDDMTVDVLLKGPYPVLLNDLAGVSILSAPWLEKHDAFEPSDPAKGRLTYTNMHANGTGPFRLVSRQVDSETVLERNPDWWDKPVDRIDRVIYRPLANDATRVAGLLSGQLDLISPTPLPDLDRIRKEAGYHLIEGQDLRVVFLAFNVAPDHIPDGESKNPLTDRRVRQALSMAIDVPGITSRVMRGQTKPIHTLIAPEIQGYDAALATPRVAYDPDGAKRLLAEAGYPAGFHLGFDCPTDRFVNSERVCQAITSMWSKIGVKVSFAAMRYPVYMAKFLNGKSDTFILGWANTPQIDAYTFLNNVLHTRTGRDGTWNGGRYSNPELDKVTERVAVEMDSAQRQRLITKAFQLERADFAAMPLYREPMVLAARRGVDVPLSPDGRVRLWLAKMN
jgi:peptide/nickel transport system substrate-binding protein